jgi:malonyl CoA-acyl carrier protein transacylase
MSRIFLFPGQGSQKKGMGEDLFDRYPTVTAEADAILGYSVKELCLDDVGERLNQTQYTQPALYTVNALMAQAKLDAGERPDLVAGHSLGEYNALLAAGVYDFATGLRLVQRRGALMSQATGGGMAAVLGLEASKVIDIIREHALSEIDVANFNAPTQVVISGPRDAIVAAQPIFEGAGCRMYVVLKVSGAFHSRYMAPAGNEFAAFLKTFSFTAPKLPVVANVTAQPYADAAAVVDGLTRQISGSVRWVESIEYLAKTPEPTFEEIGPGKVLMGLLKQIRR